MPWQPAPQCFALPLQLFTAPAATPPPRFYRFECYCRTLSTHAYGPTPIEAALRAVIRTRYSIARQPWFTDEDSFHFHFLGHTLNGREILSPAFRSIEHLRGVIAGLSEDFYRQPRGFVLPSDLERRIEQAMSKALEQSAKGDSEAWQRYEKDQLTKTRFKKRKKSSTIGALQWP